MEGEGEADHLVFTSRKCIVVSFRYTNRSEGHEGGRAGRGEPDGANVSGEGELELTRGQVK